MIACFKMWKLMSYTSSSAVLFLSSSPPPSPLLVFLLSLLSLPSPGEVYSHAAVLPQQEQHLDGTVPPQPRGEEQLPDGELLQPSVAERSGKRHLPHLPQQTEIPDVLRWEVSEPGLNTNT